MMLRFRPLQMLPFTPISEQLLMRDWVATEYPIVAKALPTAAQGWKVCDQQGCGRSRLQTCSQLQSPHSNEKWSGLL
jgi:hypothetical protein